MSNITTIASSFPIEYTNLTEGWTVIIYPAGTAFSLCLFPISGNYCLLPRLLFYVTLLFALLGWGHDWLIGGSLAAALLFSGCAAVHACLLAWVGPAYGESDVWPLSAILAASCIITVPLLNWSSTLRKTGTSSFRNETSNTRTLVVYWGIMVNAGMISITYLLSSPTTTFNNIVGRNTTSTISCTVSASKGVTLNATHEYKPSHRIWWSDNGTKLDIIDREFATNYSCTNVCQMELTALFRNSNDYLPVSASEIPAKSTNGVFLVLGKGKFAKHFEAITETWAEVLIPFIIVQGIFTIAFGRRSPRQIRDTLYLKLSVSKTPENTAAVSKWRKKLQALQIRKRVAKFVALIAYGWAIGTTILALPVLLATLVAIELAIHTLPQSESAIHIGAWTPWVATALALLAAVIANYHHRFLNKISSMLQNVVGFKSQKMNMSPIVDNQTTERSDSKPPSAFKKVVNLVSEEWKSLHEFWRNADTACPVDRYGQPIATKPESLVILPTYEDQGKNHVTNIHSQQSTPTIEEFVPLVEQSSR